MINRIVAIILVTFFFPLFGSIAFIIYLQDGLPIFFKQKRVGADYTFFYIYKFRSMKRETPNVATHLLQNPSQN